MAATAPDLAKACADQLGCALPEPFDGRDDRHLELAAGPLLQRFRQHDDVAAYTLLVELCERRLRVLAAQITRQLAVVVDPDDLVAGFMARLFTDVRRDQPLVQRFLALAYTTMRFDALNQLRLDRRARSRGASWQAMVAEHHRPVDPAEAVDDQERLERLPRLGTLFLAVTAQSFHALAERERHVLHAREVGGLSYDEIATMLDVPRPQVGMILKRARQRLAGLIEAALSTVPHQGRRRPIPSRSSQRRPVVAATSDRTS